MRHEDIYQGDPPTVRLGLCQIATEPWAVAANTSRLLAGIEAAAEQGAEIVVTPECVLHGYGFDEPDRVLAHTWQVAESIDGPNVSRVRALSQERRIHVVLGFAERGAAGEVYNAAALILPTGEVAWLYRKVHCRPFEMAGRGGAFTPGSEFLVSGLRFASGGHCVGAMICFDREVTESARCLRSLGAEFIACPLATDTSDMAAPGNLADNEVLTRCRAAENEVFIAVVNHADRFNGGSFVVGPYGDLICQLGRAAEVRVLDLPLGVIRTRLHSDPYGWAGWGNRRPDVYRNYLSAGGA